VASLNIEDKANIFKGYLLGLLPVFIKHGELNQYIYKSTFLLGPSSHS
jgi:hypothetical protein